MHDLAITNQDKALCWLFTGAIFFAMRSCEYLKTGTPERDKRTNILCLRNLVFKKEGRIIKHTSQHLASSELVIITFEFQKNTKRNKSVHMFATNDKLLNPVKAWGKTIQRILSSVPNASQDTKVCSFWTGTNTILLDANTARTKIRVIVRIIGDEVLGFGADDVGLHSIRSGGAMAMFLSGVCDIIIQRVGRWESLAFLEYIRSQIESFTLGVSQKMLENENFHHLNAKESKSPWKKHHDEDETKEGSGVSKVPYSVHFSKGVLLTPVEEEEHLQTEGKPQKGMEDGALSLTGN